jgi:hypothetical protein
MGREIVALARELATALGGADSPPALPKSA